MPGSFPGARGKRAGIEVVPDAVRRARQEAGLSQAQVAGPNFTRAAVYLTEKGKMRPTLRLLRHIAQKTQRPISYFLASSTITPEQREATDRLHRLVTTNEFAEAIEFGERQLQGELPREVEAEVRFLVGRAYIRSLDGRRAHPHLVRAQELYEVTGDQVQLADTLNQMACALHLLDDSRALTVAYQALDVCERVRPQEPELTVRTLIVLGLVLIRLQDWHRAADCYHRALEQIGSALGIRNIAMIHDHLSMTYQRLGKFGDALKHARKAMRLYRGSLDPSDLVRAEHNLGETLLRQGEFDAARVHLERALALCDERDLQRYLGGFTLLSMAELHIATGEHDHADVRLTDALRLVQQLGERTHEANAWRLWGRLHICRAEYAAADRAFAKAIDLFKKLKLPADLFDTQAEYLKGLRAQGRTDEALALTQEIIASGQIAVRRIQGGWADLVAANWRR